MDQTLIDEVAIREFCEDAVAAFCGEGLSVDVVTDHRVWYKENRQAVPTQVTPSFNPDNVYIQESDFLGALMRCGGQLVARSAIRLVKTDDLVRDELVSMRIWQNRPCPRETLECLVSADELPSIGGRVCHEGCTWVSPSQRRRGIAARLVRLMRALALARWKPSWVFGFLQPEIRDAGVAEKTYGYPRLRLLLQGYVPVVRRDATLYLSYMTSVEAASSLAAQSPTLRV